VHLAFDNNLSVDDVAGLGAEEFLDKSLVSLVVDIEFFLVVVFKLRVINHLLRNTLSSEEPDGLDVKVGNLTNDGHHSESVSSEWINSLEETVHKVAGLIKDNTLTFVLIVLGVVEAVSLVIVVVEEEINTFSSLLLWGEVNEIGLESGDIEFAGWESIEGIDSLERSGILISSGLLGSSLGSWFLFLFLLGWSNGFLGLGTELDVTESLDDLWEGDEFLEPGRNVGGNWLSEATIEGNLEGKDKTESNNDISNGESFTYEEGLALEVSVEESDLFLQVLDSVVEDFSLNYSPSKDSLVENSDVRKESGVGEINELINLSALEVVVTSKTVVGESSDVSSDGSWLNEDSLLSFENGELASEWLSLELLGFSDLFWDDFFSEFNVSELGSNVCNIGE
jgi:hypothetical protein